MWINAIISLARIGTRRLPCAMPRVIDAGTVKLLCPKVKSSVGDVVNLPNGSTIDLSKYSPEINSKFREFIDILQLRKPKHVTNPNRYSKILKYIFDNPNYKSEIDILTHLKYLTTLAAKKNPSGEFLLNGKTFQYLADFKGNGLSKEQLRDFGELISCAEHGLIPKDALEKLNIASGVNQQILKDIERIKLAKAEGKELIDVFIPEFESVIKNADEISKLNPGDFFCAKRGYSGGTPELYFITSKNGILSMGNMDRRTLFDLLPPVKRFFIAQQYSGTCYQLSAYISMLNNPKFMSKLVSRIGEREGKLMIKMPDKSTPNNLFAGKFEDFSSAGCVRTYLDESGKFIPADPEQSTIGTPLIKAMESLYGKHRKYTFADEYVKSVYKSCGKNKAKQVYKEAFNNMDRYIYIKDENGKYTIKTLEQINKEQIRQRKKTFKTVEDYYKESGEVYEIFDYFNKGFNKVSNYHSGGDHSISTLNDMRKILQTPGAVHEFGTQYNQKGWLNKGKDLRRSHGYCIQAYNPQTDMVTYINPWNSALTYDMKLEELARYIDDIGSIV